MNYLFADFETSDSNVNSLCLLEAGFILLDERFREIDRLSVKCRPRPTTICSIGALLTNNVSVKMLKGANLSHFEAVQTIQAHLKKWEPFIMIGHNLINFDAELWIRQCYKNLIPDVYQIKKLPNRMMDTLNISRASKVINNDSLKCELSAKKSWLFKLASLCAQNQIPHTNKHSAMGDASANALLAKRLFEKTPDVWESAIKTSHKSETQKILEQNKIITQVAYFYGRPRLYLNTHLFDHPIYKWSVSFDLRHDPEPLFNLGYAELQKELKGVPKKLRTCKQNKGEIILAPEYGMKAEPYNQISFEILNKRADQVRANKKFIELARTILSDEAQQKKEDSQPYLVPEQRLYLDGFPSEKDSKVMKLFHEKPTWEEKINLADSFEQEKYSFFLKTLAYEEAPDKMPKSMYSEIHKEFAKRLNSLNDEKWVTFGKFYAELDTYRNKFDKENNSEGLKILEEYDSFVQDLEKKYQIG